MTHARVLVVEDDPVLSRVLRDTLTFEGFDVDCATDCAEAVERFDRQAPDLILLDVNLPNGSGFALCETWRASNTTPIIFLTAMSQKTDAVRGLRAGADDYVTKPFDLDVLLARIHAVLRRTSRRQILTLGATLIDFSALEASRDGVAVDLTHRDFGILRYLAARPNAIVTRTELLREVWGYPDDMNTRAVDHAIARLRKKIEPAPRTPRFIHTVHGDGYVLTPNGS